MTGIEWPPLPDMGVYLNWPEAGLEAIHPDDRELAQELIPSDRVFRRTSFDGIYYTVEYGNASFRIKPSLWLQLADEGFHIGDRVEVPSRMMQADPMIAVIAEMRYSAAQGAILYTLLHNEMPFPRGFTAPELLQLTQHAHLLPSDFPFPVPHHDPATDSEAPLRIEDDLQ
jgi:hypothetical protein